MTVRPDRPVVLVANNFPPVRGGSAVVYGNLARCAGARIIVVAPRISYLDGLPTIGWREHDRTKPYLTLRLALLRTKMQAEATEGISPTDWARRVGFLLSDAWIRTRLAALLFWLIAKYGARTICVGELSASGWILRLFGWLPGLRTLAYVHGEEITTEDRYDKNHARARKALLACDAVVVVSRFTQGAVTRLLGQDAGKRIRLIENGVDTNRFTIAPKAEGLLEMYGLNGMFVFVSVCRLLEKKGVDNTLRAFAQLRADRTDIRYLIVGAGPYRAALDALAQTLNLGGTAIFAGSVPEEELADHYRLGDAFVMPNRELPNGDTEGFGLVFLEANGCGLPVIAGRDGGSTDAVQDGVNGLVVDGTSVDAIAAAMRRLYEDGALRRQLRAHGLQAAAKAGWVEKTEVFLQLCDS